MLCGGYRRVGGAEKQPCPFFDTRSAARLWPEIDPQWAYAIALQAKLRALPSQSAAVTYGTDFNTR